jgi:hypothetical protein
MKTKFHRLLFALALLAGVQSAAAQGTTAFTYQGQLHDTGTNANGTYGMIFKLYDAGSGGTLVGGPLTNSVTLANGLFAVNLDFGGAFNGAARWLDITVTNGGTTETLAPRVQLLPSPYALYSAGAASAASLASGTWNAAVGNYQTYSNVFGIYASSGLVLGLSTNGVLVNGNLQANGLGIGNSASISSDGNGGLDFNNGSSNADITINNLTLQGNSIQFSGQTGSSLQVSTNGDFVFDNNVRISSLGVITLPTPDHTGITMTGFGTGSHTIGVNGALQANSLTIVGGSTVSLQANGNGFYVPTGNFTVNGPVYASAFNTTSDRSLKEQFAPVNPADVLDRVVSLPITSWNFKTDATRHIGPMAQDFYSAFKVGTDERHIATVDEDGVALAAIQGLNEKLQAEAAQKDAQIQALEKRLADLEALVRASVQK